MRCVQEECSCCAYRRWNVVECKYDNCTYKMCKRCIFLYGRHTCPACTRDNAFKLQKKCIEKVDNMCIRILHSRHVDCICTFFVFPCIVLFGIAVLGNMILFTMFPGGIRYTGFGDFMYQGLMVMIPIMLVILCCCNCGNRSDD